MQTDDIQPRKVLIANRGEIALRVVRACRELGYQSVVVYSEADRDSLAVRLADQTVCIGRAPAAESYLRPDRVLSAAELTGAAAIHPGYGFLSESHLFAQLCEQSGLIFVGPSAEAIQAMGNKTVARDLMTAAGVPVTPGSDGPLPSLEAATACAESLGYPVLLKAVAGGGGKGMRVVQNHDELAGAYAAASAEAKKAFSDGTLFMEKFISSPKHIEVQILADAHGNVVALGDRDCSMQRRHQKLIEESPCSILPDDLRKRIAETAVQAAKCIGYTGVGTIEFLLDAAGNYYFMEMNTRIQVEHPVTEMITGIDLVKMQLEIAFGASLPFTQEDIRLNGHAIEIRINAEDPDRGFAPMPGTVSFYCAPGGPGVRVDSHLYTGYAVPPYYDSLLAKLIVHGSDRDEALARAHRALREFRIDGIPTTRDCAEKLLSLPEFISGTYNTHSVESYLHL